MRKEAGYEVSDRILLSISGEGTEDTIRDFSGYISRETLSTIVSSMTHPDLEKTEEIQEGLIIVISIQKIER